MWRVDAARALVVTVDIITPIVDDAATWGRIAATNAASDVWAMGGRPLVGLNIVGWNTAELGSDLLGDVLAGGDAAARAGGWFVVGGHSIDDPEPKYGQAVIGEVHPDEVLRNRGLRSGDALVLTKPLGLGIATTALKAGEAPAGLEERAVEVMLRPNADAAEAARRAGASAATDITGFGLLGHLRKMLEGDAVDATIDAGAVPLLPGVADLARAGIAPGGSRRNLAWAEEIMDADVDEVTALLLADAQTSGGLLFGAPSVAAAEAVHRLHAAGHDAAVIGRVSEGTGRIRVRS